MAQVFSASGVKVDVRDIPAARPFVMVAHIGPWASLWSIRERLIAMNTRHESSRGATSTAKLHFSRLDTAITLRHTFSRAQGDSCLLNVHG